jgi:hypothetical protein
MPLGRLLGLIVLVTALPLLLATYVSYQRLAANERRSIEQSLLLSTKILAGLVDNEIDEHGAVLKTLAQSRALSRGDLTAFWQEAHRAMDVVPGSWLSVNDAQGQLLMSTLVPFGSSLPQRVSADLLRAPTAKDGAVSDLRQSALVTSFRRILTSPFSKAAHPNTYSRSAFHPSNSTSLPKTIFRAASWSASWIARAVSLRASLTTKRGSVRLRAKAGAPA